MTTKPPVTMSDWLPDVEDRMDGQHFANQSISPSWPEAIALEAFHGLAGEIVSILEPHSEADPVGLLMHLLVSFGNIIGRGPHFVVGGTVHYANLYCVNVGATASRKGTAKDGTFFVIRSVDTDWFDCRVQSGLSSGEGFVWAVRDSIEEQQPIREKGRVIDYQTVIADPGVKDKRLLVVESEFGSTLRVLEREGKHAVGSDPPGLGLRNPACPDQNQSGASDGCTRFDSRARHARGVVEVPECN